MISVSSTPLTQVIHQSNIMPPFLSDFFRQFQFHQTKIIGIEGLSGTDCQGTDKASTLLI